MHEPHKILIIDDDEALNNLIANLLRDEGFTVVQEYRGSSGLRTAIRDQPDLIVLDAVTVDVQGYEVLREIKRRRIPTRIIVYTGSIRTMHEIVKFVREGACDYLEKNGDPIAVVNAVHRALSLEMTLDRHVPSPIVNEMILKVRELEEENLELKRSMAVQQWLHFAMRTAAVIVAALIMIALKYFAVVNVDGQSGLILGVLVFAVLFLPLDRLTKLTISAIGGRPIIEVLTGAPRRGKSKRVTEAKSEQQLLG